MSARYRQLAAHLRTLADDDLNDLLVDLPRHRFAVRVDTALAHPPSAESALDPLGEAGQLLGRGGF